MRIDLLIFKPELIEYKVIYKKTKPSKIVLFTPSIFECSNDAVVILKDNYIFDAANYRTTRLAKWNREDSEEIAYSEKEIIEEIFHNRDFEIIEKTEDEIYLRFRLGDDFERDLSKLEPEFSERLYQEALIASKLYDAECRNFTVEGNKLSKSLEITISI